MLIAATLMCHAPIVIPAIGAGRAPQCQATTAAMREAARRLVSASPERVVVLSPHAPRHSEAFGFYQGKLEGDFSSFGVSGVGAQFQGDPEGIDVLTHLPDVDLEPTPGHGLDHGALVPLWFLQEAGYRGMVSVLGFPWHGESLRNIYLGQQMRLALDAHGSSWALLASGDMSHALKPGAPGGFHPRAKDFDRAVVSLLNGGGFRDPSRLDPSLRALAREDVVDSLEVAFGALGPQSHTESLSYEGPFGVGYFVAMLNP